MVYRLLARFRHEPHPSSLLLDRRGRRIGKRLLDPKVEQVVESAIKRFYLTSERPRLVDVYRMTILECRKAGLRPPSYKAVWKRISKVDPRDRALKREGPKAAHDRFRPVAKGPCAKLPLELVQIDHTLADVILVDEIERRPSGRPWLTLAIDVATRMVAGSHLSLDRPSSTSVALTIAHAVFPKAHYLQRLGVDRLWPVHGIPRTIHLDNAKEFHSQALERGCRVELNCDTDPCERRTLGDTLSDSLAGSWGISTCFLGRPSPPSPIAENTIRRPKRS
jgi:putative transposase